MALADAQAAAARAGPFVRQPPLHGGNATAKFNEDPTNIAEAKREEASSYLDEWFDGAPQVEVNEDIVGLGSYGKTLTVFFADEDAGDGEDDEDEDD